MLAVVSVFLPKSKDNGGPKHAVRVPPSFLARVQEWLAILFGLGGFQVVFVQSKVFKHAGTKAAVIAHANGLGNALDQG